MPAVPRSSFQRETIGDVTVVGITPHRLVDEEEIRDLGKRLNALVKDEAIRKMLVNLGNVQYMGTMALAMFFGLWKNIEAAGGAMRFCSVQNELMEMFKLIKPFPIPIDKDEPTALSRF